MITAREFNDIRKRILNAMLLISASASVLSLTVNAINQRPWENLVFPGVLAVLVLALYYIGNQMGEKGEAIAKYSALVLINILYIPPAWLTSPGSTSAMVYYCIAIFVFGMLLVTHLWEYIFPMVTAVEVMVLLQIEALYPEMFDIYTDPVYRLFDLTINFTVVIAIIFIMLFLMTQHYRRHNEQLYQMSVTDPLTGLYNRRFMMMTLEREHNASVRTGIPYTIVIIDINNFKKINDTLGHLEGDAALRALGTILINESRSYDVCCRYGGDEFLVILPRAGKDEAKAYVDRMHLRFSEYVSRFDHLDVSLSIGVAERENHTLKEMIEIADNRLYQRKMSESKS